MAFYRRKLPRLQRDDKPHFVTFCTHRRWMLPEDVRSIVLSSCLHDDGIKMKVYVAVVMPDHVHVIFTPLVNTSALRIYSLAEIVGAMKGASAQGINQQLRRSGRVWQTESFDRVLRSSESLDAKVAYVLENPVRKGLVDKWEDYRWVWRRRQQNPHAPDKSRLAPLGGTAKAAVPT
ncbi:MAG: transposase [Candidatus Sulfotelmatobacter sp.]